MTSEEIQFMTSHMSSQFMQPLRSFVFTLIIFLVTSEKGSSCGPAYRLMISFEAARFKHVAQQCADLVTLSRAHSRTVLENLALIILNRKPLKFIGRNCN